MHHEVEDKGTQTRGPLADTHACSPKEAASAKGAWRYTVGLVRVRIFAGLHSLTYLLYLLTYLLAYLLTY